MVEIQERKRENYGEEEKEEGEEGERGGGIIRRRKGKIKVEVYIV